MAFPIIPAVVSVLGSLFFRKVTTVDEKGDTQEKRQARPVPAVLTFVVFFLVLWYFIIHPVLTYHFPEYGFPGIGAEILGAIFAAGQ